MNSSQFLKYIIHPALPQQWGGRSAEVLLLATAAQESHCGEFVHQVNGPALGVFQMEPETHDLVLRWLRVHERSQTPDGVCQSNRLVYDMRYATIMARALYRSIPSPLPEPTLEACWPYYKQHYNSLQGAATEEEFAANWARYVAPAL